MVFLGKLANFTACWLSLIAALGLSTALAQTYNAEIVGRISDPQGAVVPNADVKAIEVSRGTIYSAVSTSDGSYHIVGVSPGTYRVEVTMQGFQKAVVTDVRLLAAAQKRVDVTLEVGAVTQSIEVLDVAPTIETQRPTLAITQRREVLERPITNDSRGWVFQSMGWLPDSAPGASWMMYGSGHRDQAEFTVEGVAVNPFYAILPELSVSELQVITYNAPAEFNRPVTVNATFRSGTNDYHGQWEWTAVNPCLNAVHTPWFQGNRSPCTTQWRTLWRIGGPVRIPGLYDGRNKSFFSFNFHRNLDTIVVNNMVFSAPSPEMRAGNFANYNRIIRDPLTRTDPNDPLSGEPFPGNVIPSERINAVTKLWDSLTWGGPGVSYASPSAFRNNAATLGYWGGAWQDWVARFDQNIGQRNVLTFTVTRWPSVAWQNAPWAGVAPQTFSNFFYAISNFNLGDVHSFSPTVVNELRLGVARQNAGAEPVYHIPDGSPPPGTGAGKEGTQWLTDLGIQGITTAPTGPGAPLFSVADYSYGTYNGNPSNNFETRYQLYDNLSVKSGPHTIKTGWYSQHYAFDNPSQGPFWGSFSFDGRFTGDGFADFLLGYPGTISVTVPRPWIARRLWELSAYVQDEWAINPSVTLSYGLRWDHFTIPYDRNGLYYNFDPTTFSVVVPDQHALDNVSPLWPINDSPVVTAAQAGWPKALFNKHHYWQPRVGLAIRPGGSTKSVIRAGYGVYTARIQFDQLQTGGPFQITNSFPNQVILVDGSPQVQFTFPNPFAGAPGTQLPPRTSASAFSRDYRAPTVQQASITYERTLGLNWGFRASVITSRTTQMTWGRDLNQAPVSTTPYSQEKRPYPNWQTLWFGENGANDWYNSIQLQLSRRWANGLWLQGSYQWRRDRSDVSRDMWSMGQTAPSATDGYNRWRDFGRSGLFPTHDTVINWVWELPVGTGKKFLSDLSNRGFGGKILNGLIGSWASSGVLTWRGGNPFEVSYSGYDPGGINRFSGRPDLIAGCDPMRNADKKAKWFDRTCFSLPELGTLGSFMRLGLDAPAAWVLNVNPYKDFPLGFINETAKIRVGANIYNILNNSAYYGSPLANITSADAGTIYGGANVRQPYGDQPAGPRSFLVRASFEF